MFYVSTKDVLRRLFFTSGSFQAEMNFLTQVDKVGFDRGDSEQKIIFCLKWFKRVQTDPKESQMIKNIYVDHFGPF